MNADFDPLRSEAIRAGLVAAVSPTRRSRGPWRAGALLLAGVLVGSGATTAAFAQGRMPTGPADAPVAPSPAPDDVVVLLGPIVPGPGEGETQRFVVMDVDTGKSEVKYRKVQHLGKLSETHFVLTETSSLDFGSRPTEATYVGVTFGCRGEGGAVLVGGDGAAGHPSTDAGTGDDEAPDPVDNPDVEAPSDQDSPTSDEPTSVGEAGGVVTMVVMPLGATPSKLEVSNGCVADVTVTYYAQS